MNLKIEEPSIKTESNSKSHTENHNKPSTMKALVYHGAGNKAWEEKPMPSLKEPTDAIVKILKTSICGTDLHILKETYQP